MRFLKHFVVFAALTGSSGALAAPGWLAYGDLRGHLEPCGCDPQTDLGGIVRLRTLVGRERAAHPGMTLLSLGNNVPTKIGAQDVRLPFMIEAEVELKPTAVLFNELERQHATAIAAAGKSLGRLPNYVLTNHPKGNRPIVPFEPERRDEQHVVLGYVSPGPGRPHVPFDKAMAAAWRQRVAAAKPRGSVLLFAGTDEDLRAISEAEIFDVIVSSNTSMPMDVELGTVEKDNENRLIRLSQAGKRPAVAMVPWGGQGLRRGGALIDGEAKPIAALLQAPAPKPRDANALFKDVVLTSWLTPATGDDGSFKALYARYQAATKAAFAAEATTRAKALATSPYVGAEACQGCHATAYKSWRESQHATAYATLEQKDKHQDPSCVGCHVVGADATGGFVSKEASPQFANVQCESCHGPRKEHVASPKPVKSVTLTCETCHNAQHSPTFDREKFWTRIKHGL